MKPRPLRYEKPSKSLRIAVAVDEELLSKPRSSARMAYYRDFCLPVVASLQSYFGDLHLVGIGEGRGAGSALARIAELQPDIVFNSALSTTPAEASFIGALELLQIPFTGAGQSGMLLSRDKPRAKAILREYGISVPRGITLQPNERTRGDTLTYPVIVKPALFGGSSRGIVVDSLVTTRAALRRSVRRLQQLLGRQVLCEEFIVGREVRTAAIKGPGQEILFLDATECHFERAKPGWGFKTERMRSSDSPERDFGASSQRLSPSGPLFRRLAELTLDCANALGVRGPVTVDCRMSNGGEIHVVEVNANPGLSPRSPTWGGRRFRSNLLAIVAEGLSR